MNLMKEELTEEEVAEIIETRYAAESPKKLTEKEKQRAYEFNKELESYRYKLNNEQINNKKSEKPPFKVRRETFWKAYFEWARYNTSEKANKAITFRMAEDRLKAIIEKKGIEVPNYYAYGASTTIHYEVKK